MSVRKASVFSILTFFAVAACDCSTTNGRPAGLEILSPTDGTSLTRLDDEDPATESTIEITVEVSAVRLDPGEEVSLFPDASTADSDDPIATSEVAADGNILFTGVSLAPGEYRLQARARDGGVQSNIVRVSVTTTCASIRFVTPEPPPSTELTLGPPDDEDGEACGGEFHTTITVSTDAGDGAEARLFVNDTLRSTVTVDGTVATFPMVQLDRLEETPNLIEVEVDSAMGTCRETFPADVYVDCEGVTCSIESPTGEFLGMDDDTSDAEGFQTDFLVTSDGEAVDNPVYLVIDGDESGAPEVIATMDGMGAEARFGNVPLTEGVHTVRAICTDAAGNRTRSAEVTYTVDITPCDVAISSPTEGEVFIDADDLDDTVDGIQIAVSGTSSGAACEEFRASVCPSISGATFETLTDDAFDTQITLGSGATQEVCAQVRDEAGNIGEGRVSIEVESEAPQLEIASPSDRDGFNISGTGGRTADLDTSSSTCEAAFEVYCTEVGTSVTLHRMGITAPLTGGTADCVADGTVPSPYTGRATFSSVSLPSLDSGDTLNVIARQEGARLVGVSAAVGLLSDCNAPVLSVNRPTCGSVLRPSTDDEDTSTAGFQYEVRIFNNNDPKPPVDLEIRDSGGSVVYSATSSMPGPPSLLTNFPNADFDSGGDLEIVACATDAAGNTGCAPTCNVTVADLPTLSISSPTMSSVLTEADDCDGGTAGLQIQVTATTDASDGSDATVQIGSGTAVDTTVSSGSISVCTDASDGRDIPVRVTVTDPSRGMSEATVTVDIDTMAPTDAITPLTVTVVDRRAGVIRFQWTSVEDAGGVLLESYDLRCADAAITTEAQWSAATSVAVTRTPASAGTVQSEDISGFRIGVPRFCTLRAEDVAGRLTPLGDSPDATLPFLEQEVTAAGSAQLGYSVAPVGDVNGDTIDDVLIGAPTIGDVSGTPQAFLYFGSSGGLSSTPNVTFQGRHFTFGVEVHGLGDFNGDEIPDFAIAERGRDGAQGAVYVMFGRSDTDPAWPETIDLSAGCGADLCFVATSGTGLAAFGFSIGSGDFNGDGLSDLLVGASLLNRVYVILGSSGFTAGSEFGVPVSATITPDSSQPSGFFYSGSATLSQLGQAVISIGDFTGSGEDDLIMTAPGSTSPVIDGAVLYVAGRTYPGSAVGLQEIPLADAVTIDTGTPGRYGVALGSADYNGDGQPDLGVYATDSNGRVFFYPNSGGFSAATRVTFSNDASGAAGDSYGASIGHGAHPWLGSVGRIDPDGRQELLLGSSEDGTDVASVALFFGQSSISGLPRSQASLFFQPPAAGGSSGRRIGAFIGDVDGDGFNDIALGDRSATSNAGRVIIYY